MATHDEVYLGKKKEDNSKEYNIDAAFDRLETKIKKLEEQVKETQDSAMNHYEGEQDWYSGWEKRISTLESIMKDFIMPRQVEGKTKRELYTDAPAIWELKRRIKNLEALHKTDKPAEFADDDFMEKKGILYKFFDSIKEESTYIDSGMIDYFLTWLDKNGYEIREKKK